MNRLPTTTDELRGRRAARWIRESTAGQVDNFGPDAQREQQDRAIERYGLADTGLAWQVAHSGRTVATTDQWAAMRASAGVAYDVLLVGYVSRFARNAKVAFNVRDELHSAGAAVLFCDERILSSDDDAWEAWAREAVEAEAYSRRLAKRIREGYAAKFRRHADQGGSAPLGFRRTPERPYLLEVDPATIERVTGLFTVYARGAISHRDLGHRTDIAPAAVRAILANPIYNGWVRRHRRGRDEQLAPARWRQDPPVDDELWARVQAVRQERAKGGGGRSVRVHLLAGLLWCRCGRRIKADVATPKGYVYRRYRHMEPCDAWAQGSVGAEVYEGPIGDQIANLHLDQATLDRVRALALAGEAPASTYQRRALEHELRGKAEAHAARRLSTEAYLAEHARISAQLDELGKPTVPGELDPDAIVEELRNLPEAWRLAAAEPAAQQALIRALFTRLTVAGDRILEIEPTAAAYRLGLDQAMTEYLAVARPAGSRRGPARYRTVIVGRTERRAAALRLTA